jgi:hypothetical protein
MSSKFAIPFLKKSPLQGAYENAADGKAFMGGLVTGQEQFAKLQQDITKGFDNYMKGEGTQQRLEKESQDNVNEIKDKTSDEYKSAQAAHDKRFGGVKKENKEAREKLLEWLNDPANKDATASQIAAYKTALGL